MNTNLKSYRAHTVQRPATVADRRKQIPVNMAVKKYYNDIGSRLSEMVVPEQYPTDRNERLSQDFCMLTIDTRHLRSLKQKENASQSATVNRVGSSSDDSGLELSTATSPYMASSRSSTSFNAADRENRPRGKRNLLYKLTCSLFLRKHMCSRCKRRSRSCVSNKTFCGTEKHYMCCRCRETSQTIRNIFDEHSSSKDSLVPHSTQGQQFVSDSKKRSGHISRKNGKDSGYETVTSCSTVASAFSAFSTPANIRQNISKDKTSVKPVMYGDLGPSSESCVDIFKHINPGRKYEQDLHVLGVYSEPDNSSETTADSESDLSNFQADDHQGSTEDELLQVKQRNVQKHDGYIPDTIDHNTWGQNKSRPVLSDTSNQEDASENGDYCYFPPRIIRVSQTGKNTTTSQKSCYTCDSISKPCFRLPWEGGWICEDCLDGLH